MGGLGTGGGQVPPAARDRSGLGVRDVPPASRALVASLCGQADWNALMAALDEARARIEARWAQVKEGKA